MKINYDLRMTDNNMVRVCLVPSAWHRLNLSPDTYQRWSSDSHDFHILEYYAEEVGERIEWDDLEWEYNHSETVRKLSEVVADWVAGTMMELGLYSVTSVKVTDSWSPREYNFQSDGFEMEFLCDLDELLELSEGFDVDEWAKENYTSRSGFISFVPSRLEEEDWRVQYDLEFRVEYVLSKFLESDEAEYYDAYEYSLDEEADEIYMKTVKVTPSPEVFLWPRHRAVVNELGEHVRHYFDKGWATEAEAEAGEFYPTLLTYHRESCKLVDTI